MKYLSVFIFLLTISVGFGLCQQQFSVTIPQGTLVGLSTNNQTKSFLGVRFAQTTAGANRFKPPVAVDASTSTFNATSYGNICVQTPDSTLTYSEPQSEDCLFLNIWAPIDASPSKQYPVVLWIHGGSFVHGTANIYDGEHWVTTSIDNNVPVIFISINYRLGVFGFLFDTLFKNENGLTATNFGLLDQLAALKWVKQNIANFGGNPNQITLSGESAGGISTLVLVASPLISQVSLSGAIVQSGSSLKWLMQTANTTAIAQATALKTAFNCSTIDCLRSLSADELNSYQAVNASSTFGVTFDNYIITQNTYDAIDSGNYAKVNLLIGTTRNEMTYFTCGKFPSAITSAQMQYVFSSYFGAAKTVSFFPQLSNYYNISAYQDNLDYLNEILTQAGVQCNARYLAASLSRTLNTYLYVYDHYFSFITSCQKSMHTMEIPIQFPAIFKHMKGAESYTLTSSELELSRQLIVYWSNFIASGNPNNNKSGKNLRSNQLVWDKYSTCNDSVLVIQSGSNYATSSMFAKTCPFWSTYEEVPIIPCVSNNATNSTPIVPANSTKTNPTKSVVNNANSFFGHGFALCVVTLLFLLALIK